MLSFKCNDDTLLEMNVYITVEQLHLPHLMMTGERGVQIRCGDQYEDSAVQTFNSCAVSQKKCVPQRVDKDVYPVSAAQQTPYSHMTYVERCM